MSKAFLILLTMSGSSTTRLINMCLVLRWRKFKSVFNFLQNSLFFLTRFFLQHSLNFGYPRHVLMFFHFTTIYSVVSFITCSCLFSSSFCSCVYGTTGIYRVHQLWWVPEIYWGVHDQARTYWWSSWILTGNWSFFPTLYTSDIWYVMINEKKKGNLKDHCII